MLRLRLPPSWPRPSRAGSLLVAAGLLLPGCAGLTGPRDAGSWFVARGADMMDTVGVRLGVGVGLGAYARITQSAQLGFMLRGPAETELVGASETARSDRFEVRGVPCVMVGTIGRYGGLWSERSREVMIPFYSTRDEVPGPIRRRIIAGVVPLDGEADNWRGSVGAGLHLVVLGVEAEVRPFEFLDFFAGLLGYDPSADDVPVAPAPEGEADPGAVPAAGVGSDAGGGAGAGTGAGSGAGSSAG
jgi:hypothetical protein